MSLYSGLYKILAKPIRAAFRLSAVGTENLPEGGVLLCANHTSLLDVFVISVALSREVKYMAKKELFRVPVLASLISALGAFPVDRGGADVGAIKKTVGFIETGNLVGMFPQGTRRPGEDPRKTEVKSGAGMIAYRSKCDVIPVYIKSKNNRTLIFRKTTVIVGEPIRYGEFGFEKGGSSEYKAASELIFDRICTLGENN